METIPFNEEMEVLSAYEVSRAVSDDYDAALVKYENKTVVIKGTVGRTYISPFLTPNVELLSGDGAKVTFVLPYGGVTRGMGQLSDFKPGQEVTMQGRIIGIREDFIVLKESNVVEVLV